MNKSITMTKNYEKVSKVKLTIIGKSPIMVKNNKKVSKAKFTIMGKSPTMVKTCEKISKISIYLLAFLMPIFFLPWTSNVLDFNKQALLIVLVFVSLFAWILKTLISGKLKISLSLVHIPIILLFLVYLISTIFSAWRYGSFWGWPQITAESLITLLGFSLLYFLLVNIFEKREILHLITMLLFSCFLAIAFGSLQLFGKFLLPFDFSKGSLFNTIGMVNILGVFTAVLLPLLVISLIINTKKYLKGFAMVAIILSAILLILVNFPTAWWLVIVGSAMIIAFGMQKREFFDSRWLVLPMFFLALALFFSLFGFQIPASLSGAVRPSEIFLTQKDGLDIATQTLRDSPIFGSGPGTFVYNFSKYKSISFNQSSFWNIRFNQAGSKFLTTLSTTGILGALSFLVLIGFFVFYGIKFLFKKPDKAQTENLSRALDEKTSEEVLSKTEEERNEGFFWILGSGIFISFTVLSIGYFLYESSLSLDFVYFLLIGSFISLFSSAKKEFLLKPSSLITLVVTFVFTMVFIFGLGILILGGQKYLAEINYSKGVRAWQEGRGAQSLEYLTKTVRINPKIDLYWRELSQVYLWSIDEVARSTDLSREEITQRIQIFINNTVNSAKVATDVNPNNVANWSVRGFIYQNLIGVISGTKDWAVDSYEEALKLEPTNPYFPTQSGISLLKENTFLSEEDTERRRENLSKAEEQFKKAIELKSDYAPAHFQLAIVYQAQGKQLEAISELERARDSAPNDIGLAFQLGLVYYQNKDFQKARIEFERAVLLNSSYSNALYFLGLTYNQLGEKELTVAVFKRILALNPDNLQVEIILDNLEAGRSILAGIVEDVPPVVPIEEEHLEIEE